MNGEWTYVPSVANWTYPCEEAMWWADHSQNQRDFEPPRRERFSFLQERFEGEFSQFIDFLKGKLEIPWRLNYIEHPEDFDYDLTMLDKCWGDCLTFADLAWIKNTRELIKKYHVVLEKLMEEGKL